MASEQPEIPPRDPNHWDVQTYQRGVLIIIRHGRYALHRADGDGSVMWQARFDEGPSGPVYTGPKAIAECEGLDAGVALCRFHAWAESMWREHAADPGKLARIVDHFEELLQ